MQIVPFLPYYQLVYIDFDLSSFSLISYVTKAVLLAAKSTAFTREKSNDYDFKIVKTLIHKEL